MAVSSSRLPLAPLVSTEGERHAEFKRRRDEYLYMKVPAGGETPYLAEGWEVEKVLKRQIRLQKQKPLDRKFEDSVWRLFYRMGYDDLNKSHDFTIQYRASDGTLHRTRTSDPRLLHRLSARDPGRTDLKATRMQFLALAWSDN